jgi:hypothetical protein
VESFPVRFADFLESIVVRIRSLTVDRVAKGIRLSTLGMVAATLGIMALVFLLLTVYGALAIPLGNDGALGVLGGAFLIGALIMWRKSGKLR